MATFAPRFTCRETAASLTSRNPIPYDGEICCESDTGKIKIGDGRTAWNDLSYAGDGTGSAPTTKQVATNLSFVAATTITDFTFAASANTTYLVSGLLLVGVGDADKPVNVTCSVPSGATADGTIVGAGAAAAESMRFDESGVTQAMQNGLQDETTPCLFSCIVRTSSSAGDVSFSIGRGDDSGTNSLLARSSISITAIS